MSTATVPAAGAVRKPGFGNVLGSEWTKIRTVRSTYWTGLGTLAVSIGLSAAFAALFATSYDSLDAEDRIAFDPTAFGMLGASVFGILVMAVFGVLVITPEFATGMIRTSLTAVPKRGRYFVAKALVLVLVAMVIGLVSTFVSYFLSQLIFSSKHLNGSIGDPGVLRAVIGGGLYLALVGLFAYALGAILRHTAGAVSLALGIVFVLPIFANFLPGSWGRTVAKFMPSNAGSAIMNTHPQTTSLAPWTGFGVFCLYVVILLVIAYVLFEKRDA
ncbi:ABC transporter permease subunit [Actinocorallia longicatena]|uniref:ABC transporter permease subunit n=1 Tax=Actinocorallia longicatena TaxID=111803 RepID=A0ABP6QDU5_9ACTN